MKPSLGNLLAYSKLIGRKWIFWLFALLDILGLLAQVVFPQLQIPTGPFIALAFIGFFWAGFQVYGDLASRLPSRPIPPPPFELLPLSFEVSLSQEIPKINIWLYISNHQSREIIINSLELTSFNLAGGRTLDVIQHSDEITIPKSQSKSVCCRRTLTDSEIRSISKTQILTHATASYSANARAALGRKHVSQRSLQMHTTGRILGIEQAE